MSSTIKGLRACIETPLPSIAAIDARSLFRHERRVAFLMAFAVVGAACSIVYVNWALARSVQTGAAGFLPTWDAFNYYWCGNNLLDLEHFGPGGQRCNWRPIYASFLGTLIATSGRNLHVALLLQATLVSLAIVILVRELWRLVGLVGAIAALVLLGVFASRYCFPNIMTENLGFAFGAVALALLLRGAEISKPWVCYFGIAVLSLALNARAGCFFVLATVALWAGLNARIAGRSVLVTYLCIFCAAAAGFLLHFALIALNGIPSSESHGNFSWTLYGLAVGGKGWIQGLSDRPELGSADIYRLALQIIIDDPRLILHALWNNLLDCLKNGVGLYGGYIRGLEVGIWGLWVLGFIAIATRLRDPRHSLIGFLTIGGLMSGPFIVQDGGPRVFAATFPVDVAQMVLGLGLVCQLAIRLRHSREQPEPQRDFAVSRAAIGLPVIFIAAILAPYTPLRQFAALRKIEAPACPDGDRTLVARLGRETVGLTVMGSDGSAQVFPPRAPLNVLVGWLPATAERGRQTFMRPTPYSFMLAYQRSGSYDDFGVLYPLRWAGDLAPFYGNTIRICFRTQDSERNDLLWGITYIPRFVTTVGK